MLATLDLDTQSYLTLSLYTTYSMTCNFSIFQCILRICYTMFEAFGEIFNIFSFLIYKLQLFLMNDGAIQSFG